ncbi:MAG TPA: HAMP domain-containing sensor histidine kinase [Candidatus Dormibacteraeota bacterium]
MSPRGRPPWWPEGERWPPRRNRPWFFGRIVAFVLLLWVLSAATMGFLGALVARGGPRFIPLPLILLAGAFIFGIVQMRRATASFAGLRRRVEAGDQRRRTFLADVAHELKTPLAVIRGQAEGIADGVYQASAESVKPILEATHTLELLIEDLRTLALSEAGALVLNREPVDLALLVHEVLAAQPASEVALREDLPADLPHPDADPVRLRAVLNNLVANALRHTPAGGSVTVSARRQGGGIEVSVSDTGEGIPPELLPRIFERFVRGPSSRGSGLGLAIAKDVVEAHGGTIAAQSQPGKGTVIRFTIPSGSR